MFARQPGVSGALHDFNEIGDCWILCAGEELFGFRSYFGPRAGPLCHFSAWRAAELAKLLASVLCSRRTWEIEKSSDRANFRQIQFRE